MEPRPDIQSLCCVNPECKHFSHKGQRNLKVRKTYGKDKIRYLRCSSCGEEFSERIGSRSMLKREPAEINLRLF
jgi:hypothetical protein